MVNQKSLHVRRISIDSRNEPQSLGWPKNKLPNLPRPDFSICEMMIVFTYLIKRCQTLINVHNGLEICD